MPPSEGSLAQEMMAGADNKTSLDNLENDLIKRAKETKNEELISEAREKLRGFLGTDQEDRAKELLAQLANLEESTPEGADVIHLEDIRPATAEDALKKLSEQNLPGDDGKRVKILELFIQGNSNGTPDQALGTLEKLKQNPNVDEDDLKPLEDKINELKLAADIKKAA